MSIVRRVLQCLTFSALCISCLAINGCAESSFQLARESRLPKFITTPAGLTRADVSVTLDYYSFRAKFTLKDKKGKKLAKVSGKMKGRYPQQLKNPSQGFDPGYPAYEVITVNGTTDIIEHRRMEPIFYVADDPAVWKELLGVRASNP